MKEENIEKLIEKALTVRYSAYAPYSRFYVGAALLAKSGKIYTGVNVENASFPVGLCAERGAFAAALAKGERDFSGIAIVGAGNGKKIDFCPPCGLCRQFMAELCSENFEVILATASDKYKTYKLGELLPKGFKLK